MLYHVYRNYRYGFVNFVTPEAAQLVLSSDVRVFGKQVNISTAVKQWKHDRDGENLDKMQYRSPEPSTPYYQPLTIDTESEWSISPSPSGPLIPIPPMCSPVSDCSTSPEGFPVMFPGSPTFMTSPLFSPPPPYVMIPSPPPPYMTHCGSPMPPPCEQPQYAPQYNCEQPQYVPQHAYEQPQYVPQHANEQPQYAPQYNCEQPQYAQFVHPSPPPIYFHPSTQFELDY